MLSDARSLWLTASSAIATLNENISTALENLDNENKKMNDEQEDVEEENSISRDLETYKKLLDDAQMQHFELSKQSRIIIAEKEAELKYFRDLFNNKKDHNVQGSDDIQLEHDEYHAKYQITLEKLKAEKLILEESLLELQEKMKNSLHENNDYKVLKKNYDDLLNRFDALKTDFSEMRVDIEVKEKQKNETIDNLVEEYSKLAAESELIQNQCNKRLMEILKENEVLTTRMHALEHSITELADRSVAVNKVSTLAESTSSNLSMEDQTVSQILNELRETKAKLVNIQFDLKEKEDMISQLKLQLSSFDFSTKSPSPTPVKMGVDSTSKMSMETDLNSLNEIKNLKNDVVRLVAEKREAEDAGKKFFDQLKKLQKQMELMKIKNTVDSEEGEAVSLKDQQQLQQVQQLEGEIIRQKKELHEKIEEKEEFMKKFDEKYQLELKQWMDRTNKQSDEIMEQNQSIQNLSKKLLTQDEELQKYRKDCEDLKNESMGMKKSFELDVMMKEQTIQQLTDELIFQKQASVTGNETLKNDLESVYVTRMSQLQLQMEELMKEKMTQQQQHLMEMEQLRKETSEHCQNEILKGVEAEQLKSVQILQDKELIYQKQIESLRKELEVLKEKSTQVEVDMVNLRATHVKEIQKVIEDTKQHEAIEWNQKLNELNQRLQLESDKKLQVELMELQVKLDGQHREAMDMVRMENSRALASSLSELTLRLNAEKKNALQLQLEECEEKLKQSLDTLKKEKEVELQMKLNDLEKEKNLEKERDLRAANELAVSRLEDQRRDYETKMEQLNMEIMELKLDLKTVEQRYEVITAKELVKLGNEKDKERSVALESLRSKMQVIIDQSNKERDENLANYTKERKLRKKIHNTLMDLQGNIRVLCRIRPILEVEKRSGEDVDVTEIPNDEELIIQRDSQTRSRYEYDRVFAPGSTQEEVFEAVQPLCVSVLDGYNVSIFAYGQTGSGKTYTMEGYGSNIGVSPRAIAELLNQVEQLSTDWSYTLTLSMLEIYNETILDLMTSTKEKLEIRQTPEGNQVIGLVETTITSMEQVQELMKEGQANRAVGSHDMNEHSSRSHSILTVTCRGKNKIDGSTTFGTLPLFSYGFYASMGGFTRIGKLHLIDLAGSERISKTDATGDRLKEAQNINKSLSALGDVINALGNKKSTHIPYRNSKLTFLLQDSLGGNSKVLSFVNISPAIYNLGETVCSLNFATRCRSTELGQAKKQSGEALNSITSSSTSTAKVSRDKKMITSSASLSDMHSITTGTTSSTSTLSSKDTDASSVASSTPASTRRTSNISQSVSKK